MAGGRGVGYVRQDIFMAIYVMGDIQTLFVVFSVNMLIVRSASWYHSLSLKNIIPKLILSIIFFFSNWISQKNGSVGLPETNN